MKKIFSVCVLGLTLLLTGCANAAPMEEDQPTVVADSATPEAPVEVEPTEEPLPQSVREGVYLHVIRSEYPFLVDIPDETLISFANSSCGALDNGATLMDIFDIIIEGTGTEEEKNAQAGMVGSGVAAFCPQHQYLFEDISNA